MKYYVFDKNEWTGIIPIQNKTSHYFPLHINVSYSNGAAGFYIILQNNKPILMTEEAFDKSQDISLYTQYYPFGTPLTDEEFETLATFSDMQNSNLISPTELDMGNQQKQKVLEYANRTINTHNLS